MITDLFVTIMFLVGCLTTFLVIVLFLLWWFTFKGTSK